MSLRETIILPGTGSIAKLDIRPIKASMSSGALGLRAETAQAFKAIADTPDTPKHCVQALWETDDAKGFRNAYTSLVTEKMWPKFLAAVSGENTGRLYRMRFNEDGISSLTEARLNGENSAQRALLLGVYNEMAIDHFILEEFANGNVPQVSEDEEKNRKLLEEFQLLTDIGRRHDIFRASGIPPNTPSPGVFIIRGVRATRTQFFGLPNLITDRAAEAGYILTPEQHRDAYVRSIRAAVTPYYLPTFPMVDELNGRTTVGDGADELNPDSFSSMGGPDDFVVFVQPDIVREVNGDFDAREGVQSQTNCPVFSARVETPTTTGLQPFPRSLNETVMEQLDRHFYPAYRREYTGGEIASPIFSLTH